MKLFPVNIDLYGFGGTGLPSPADHGDIPRYPPPSTSLDASRPAPYLFRLSEEISKIAPARPKLWRGVNRRRGLSGCLYLLAIKRTPLVEVL
jgi:hypothetical protein